MDIKPLIKTNYLLYIDYLNLYAKKDGDLDLLSTAKRCSDKRTIEIGPKNVKKSHLVKACLERRKYHSRYEHETYRVKT